MREERASAALQAKIANSMSEIPRPGHEDSNRHDEDGPSEEYARRMSIPGEQRLHHRDAKNKGEWAHQEQGEERLAQGGQPETQAEECGPGARMEISSLDEHHDTKSNQSTNRKIGHECPRQTVHAWKETENNGGEKAYLRDK